MVQNITGLSGEAAKVLADKLIPSLEEVKKAAEGGKGLEQNGYFFQDR